ncbi:hypothetical protein F8M41_014046 [Gigaspora margarita]|uniref:Uncharacterized protein n=1 Tax=Gigaspora margarita TaxID=4874 RepID=A0A8H3ZYA3_GIGMA|nr:hypothetical protein F8M41_014046 [Gigaspora margarita]
MLINVLVIDGHEWARNVAEYSLRYKTRNGLEFLDLTDYNISGHVKLKNFDNLEELDCSSKRKFNPRTKDYNDHSKNNIKSLDLSECRELRNLDCSSNMGLTELNISNCSNLAKINVIGCLGLRKVICYNTPYSSAEIIKQAKMPFCLNYQCREAAYYDGYCNMHRRHCCKEEGCNSQIYISEEYCSAHQSICKIPGCPFRSFLNSDCDFHRRERENELRRIRQIAIIRRENERNHGFLIFLGLVLLIILLESSFNSFDYE